MYSSQFFDTPSGASCTASSEQESPVALASTQQHYPTTPKWSIERLKNASNYHSGQVCPCWEGGHENMDYTFTEVIFRIRSLDGRTPTQDMIFAIHRDGMMSGMLIARAGNYGKMRQIILDCTAAQNADCNISRYFHRPNQLPRDPRARFSFASYQDEMARLFLNLANAVAPHNKEVQIFLTAAMERSSELLGYARAGKKYPGKQTIPPILNIEELNHGNCKDRDDPYDYKDLILLSNTGWAVEFRGAEAILDSDRYEPRDFTLLQRAIIFNKPEDAKLIVRDNPRAILERSPWGDQAIDMAYNLGPTELFRIMVETYQAIPNKTVAEENSCRDNYEILQRLERERGKTTDTQESHENYIRQRNIAVRDLLNRRDRGIPQRHPFLQAAIEGDLEAMITMAKEKPFLITKACPLGFDPIAYAIRFDQMHVVRWLLTQNYTKVTYNPQKKRFEKSDERRAIIASRSHRRWDGKVNKIDNYYLAKSPRMLALMLHYRAAPGKYFEMLINFVMEGNEQAVDTLLQYGYKIIKFTKPFNIVEWLIHEPNLLKSQHSTPERMLKILLKYYDRFLPESPYDPQVTEGMRSLIEAHNRRIARKMLRRRPRVVAPTNLVNDKLIAELDNNSERVISQIIPCRDVSWTQWFSKKLLSSKNFTINLDLHALLSTAYATCRDLFRDHSHVQHYTNICNVGDNSVSFVDFSIHHCDYKKTDDEGQPIIEKFTLVHVTCSAVEDDHAQNGYPSFGFLNGYSLKAAFPDRKVIICYTSLKPCYSRLLAPDDEYHKVMYFPKCHYDLKFIRYVLGEMKKSLDAKERTVTSAIAVKQKNPALKKKLQEMWQIQEANQLCGGDDSRTIPIIFEVTEELCKNYIKKLNYPGVDMEYLIRHGRMLDALDQREECRSTYTASM